MEETVKPKHTSNRCLQGYAPGSWCQVRFPTLFRWQVITVTFQVAVNRTAPGGRIIGVDILPATPPSGVSTIQGDFLSPAIQAEVRAFVQDPTRGQTRRSKPLLLSEEDDGDDPDNAADNFFEEKGYIEMERSHSQTPPPASPKPSNEEDGVTGKADGGRQTRHQDRDAAAGRVVDVVLSDMSAPWEQTSGFHKRSISDPYHRMMNTSGMAFRDHAGSMV